MITGGGGAGVAGWFKVCELTKTTISSWLRTYIIITPIAWIVSVFYMDLFWRISPIPSVTYPAANVYWPVEVINRLLWVGGKVGIGLSQFLMISSFLIGSVVAVICGILHLPISVISIAVGASTPLPSIVTVFLGMLVSKFFIKRWGKASWNKNRTVLVAGIFLGQSIIIGLAVSASMIFKGLWILPY